MNYFPKGALQMTVWQLWDDGSQIHIYLEFLSACRGLWQAGCIPSQMGFVRTEEKSAITELSPKNSLECNICLEITFWGCAFIASCQKWRCYRGEEILKERFSLLCESLYVVLAAFHNTDRDIVSPHRLLLVLNVFSADVTNAVLGFSTTVYKMISYSTNK